jgi:predicted DNA-binding antitoxin AbrB/MazE fold protein
MTITVEATVVNGLLKPKQPLTLDEGSEVRLTITPLAEDRDPREDVIGICAWPFSSTAPCNNKKNAT